MRAKIFFITLAVDDLDRSVGFYRDGLGWPAEGIAGQQFHDEVTGADGTIAIFTLDGGLLLTLYERTNLAKDASLPAGPPSSTEFSLGIPAQSQAEVDRLLVQVEAAGGTLTAPAHMRPFGVYSGYFTDPDGHLFEIARNSNEQDWPADPWCMLPRPAARLHGWRDRSASGTADLRRGSRRPRV